MTVDPDNLLFFTAFIIMFVAVGLVMMVYRSNKISRNVYITPAPSPSIKHELELVAENIDRTTVKLSSTLIPG
jgi:hypothetical protein